MQNINEKIIEALKNEFEYRDKDNEYDQWVMGVSIRQEENIKRVIGTDEYKVKVVVKTSESNYVDGMRLEVIVMDGKVVLQEDFFEKSPDLMGSPEEDSIKWLLGLGDIIYLQELNPYELKVYRERLKDIVREYFFTDLMEYTIDSSTGANLVDLYQDLIQETLLKRVEVSAREISDGKYELEVIVGDNTYTINSKGSYTKEDVIQEIRENIIIPLMKNEEEIEK